MSTSPKEFLDLLNSISDEKTFTTPFTNKQEYTFNQITTSQLKELIRAVVDSPLTQASFNTAIDNVMKTCLVTEGATTSNFNSVDRILFALDTRIHAISPTFVIDREKTETVAAEKVDVDIKALRDKLFEGFHAEPELLKLHTVVEDSVEIVFGIPNLETEGRLNKEIYSNKKYNNSPETQDDLRDLLGELFINEIVKCIKTLKIKDSKLDLSLITFAQGLKIVEKLPAKAISKIISFVERYKKAITNGLTVKEDVVLSIDGSLFSLR